MDNSNKDKLIYCMISALTLEWADNGNIMAEAVRDLCIQAVADTTGQSFDDVLRQISQRAEDLQG